MDAIECRKRAAASRELAMGASALFRDDYRWAEGHWEELAQEFEMLDEQRLECERIAAMDWLARYWKTVIANRQAHIRTVAESCERVAVSRRLLARTACYDTWETVASHVPAHQPSAP